MAGGFLHELHAGVDAQFRVYVAEVGLHGPRRYEQPRRDFLVPEAFAHQPYDVVLGGSE